MPTFLPAMADSAVAGCLVKPIIAGFMASGEKLSIRAQRPTERAPDGWFHASSHPGLPAAELAAYLALPPVVSGDPIAYPLAMSFTVGTVIGEVARQILVRQGVAIIPRGICIVCGLRQPTRCREHAGVDSLRRSRGHLDAVLNFSSASNKSIPGDLSLISPETLALLWGYDHKTAMTMTLKGIPEMDEEALKAKWPKYWWQAQEYMRLTGLRKYIIVVQGIGTPWTMKEYHIQFDPDAALSIERRYREAMILAGL